MDVPQSPRGFGRARMGAPACGRPHPRMSGNCASAAASRGRRVIHCAPRSCALWGRGCAAPPTLAVGKAVPTLFADPAVRRVAPGSGGPRWAAAIRNASLPFLPPSLTRHPERSTSNAPGSAYAVVTGVAEELGGPPAGGPAAYGSGGRGRCSVRAAGAVASPRPRADTGGSPRPRAAAAGCGDGPDPGPGARKSVRKRYGTMHSDQGVYALLRTALVGAVRLLRRSAYPCAYTGHRRQPAGTCKLFGMPRNRNTGAPRLVITT